MVYLWIIIGLPIIYLSLYLKSDVDEIRRKVKENPLVRRSLSPGRGS